MNGWRQGTNKIFTKSHIVLIEVLHVFFRQTYQCYNWRFRFKAGGGEHKRKKTKGIIKKRNPKILWFHSLKTNYFLSSVGEKKILNSKIIGRLFWFTLYLADYSFSHQQEKASQTDRPEIMSFDCNWQKKHLRERKKYFIHLWLHRDVIWWHNTAENWGKKGNNSCLRIWHDVAP